MFKIAVLDDYHRIAPSMADWRSLPKGTDVTFFHDRAPHPEALVRRLEHFSALVAMRERTAFPCEILEKLPRLELLVTTGMANRSVDVSAAARLGIRVCGTSSGGFEGTVELTWALILALARHLPAEDHGIRNGHWGIQVGHCLAGKTLGVLGLGRIGSSVARIAGAFNMHVLAWSRRQDPARSEAAGARYVSLDTLLSSSDVVSLHLQLSDETRGIIGENELKRMKKTALLINTARGAIVDEAALVRALTDGTLAGAGLDVFVHEPLPPGHPFRTMGNTVLTPHIGYVTRESYHGMFRDALEDITAYLEGRPIRLLDGGKEPSRPQGAARGQSESVD